MPAADKFSMADFGLRAAFALALVLLTFNPSGYSYVHWIREGFPSVTPVQALAGVVLLIGWCVFVVATLRSIGLLGVLLALALFGTLLWLIVSWGWVTLQDTGALLWIGVIVLSLILAIGMSWSHLYQRWSGQATVDEADAES